jgi:hypothetical protein
MKATSKKRIALLIFCAGTLTIHAQFTTGSGNIIQSTLGNVGLGYTSGTPTYQLDVKVPAVSGGENIMNITVSDQTSDFLRVINGTSSNNHFMPTIVGYKSASLSAATGLYIMGSVSGSNDVTGSSEPVINFNVRKDFTGTNAAIANRILFQWSNYSTKLMTMISTGDVGIGTTTPLRKLHVGGDLVVSIPSYIGTAGNYAAMIRGNGSGVSSATTPDYTWFNNDQCGIFHPAADVIGFSNGTYGERMRIHSNGYVGIGTTAPTAQLTVNGKTLIGDPGLSGFMGVGSNDYLLFVQKGILAEKVRVAVCTSASWADYVFEKDYKLKTIEELETYITENKHLPNIPSAKEVVDNGLDLATINSKLLEKVEELSLYIIQQNKRIDALEQAVEKK